jgi:hypothetical protein
LKEGGFDIELAPPVKLTGFENMMDYFPSDHFGNDLWLHHRGPLKFRFPNGPLRNAIPVKDGRIGPLHPVTLKTYEDGFSFRYLEENKIQEYH